MLDTVVIKTSVAVEYGTNVAIVLGNVNFWVQHNKENGVNFHDGRYWTFNSVAAFHRLIPFLSEKAISAALSKAEDSGLIVTGNYNALPFDRTKWYALTEKGEQLYQTKAPKGRATDSPSVSESITPKGEIDSTETGEAITPQKGNDITPQRGDQYQREQIDNPEENNYIVRKQASSQRPAPSRPWNDEEGERVAEVVQALNDKTGSRYRPHSAATMRPILARLREGFTVEDCREVIRKKSAEWGGTDMAKFLRPQTLFGSKFESYLNAPENPRDRTEAAIRRNVSRYSGVIDEDEEF